MDTIRILIADDHTVFCDCLKKVLEMQTDFKVVGIAKNGPEAVRRAEETRPDVVLMDVQMPVLDGIRSTRLIKERLPSTNVVVLSMHTGNQYVMDSIDAGAHGYLLKDFSIDEVVQAVRSAAKGNHMLTRAIFQRLFQQTGANDESTKLYGITYQLTERELQVISLVAAGLTNKEIGNELCLSYSTIKNHLSNIFGKLHCSNRAELVNKAIHENLIKTVIKEL
ncbi:response regulator transcription factor [Desulfoscipio gibsoniae]|uniref:Stage 0 sporulation protein A homolog n=1 Tax=Desulfoscipio gibsoniae DSM 7213 TaxID=767817 RepID=R4KLY6_9FIRM|nr:response regulator transcription factor [Desulfoscipio gibsoniae]AGL00656.1 response regulator containing a CheY-like receiver domain and an HTH DNA-binding domain [Desulfoscipio gibsoniae DSM 7213]